MLFNWQQFLLVIFVFLIHVQTLLAQRPQVDSLKGVLHSGVSGEKRIDALSALAYQLYDSEDSVAFSLSKQALLESNSIQYLKGIKYANTLLGLGHVNKGEYGAAVACFRNSDAIESTPETFVIAGYNLTLLGNLYRETGRYDSAEFIYAKAIKKLGGEDSDDVMLATTLRHMAKLDILRWQNAAALIKLQKAEIISTNADDTYNLVDIWSLFGRAYENLLDFDKAQTYFKKMRASAEREGDLYHLITCDLDEAEYAYRQGDYSASLKHCFQALKKSDVYYYPPQRAEIYLKIGDVYTEFSQYDLALKYFLETLKISEKLGLVNVSATTYSAMAGIYKDQLNFTTALEYIGKSQVIRESLKSEHGISNCHNIRGLIFYQQKQYDAAIAELKKSIQIREKIKHTEGIASATYNLSLVYEDLNQLDKAVSLQLDAIRIEEKIDNKQNLGISYSSLAALLIKLGRLGEAEKNLKNAQRLALFTKSKMLQRNNFKVLSILYETKGNYPLALLNQRKFQEMNDSIYSEGSAVKMSEIQAIYQMEKKDKEIELLSKDMLIQENQLKIKTEKINRQSIIIVCGITLFLLICFVGFKTFQYNKSIRLANLSIKEQKEEIQAQSEEITEAYNTISDINRNLELKIDERTKALRQAYKELDTFFYRSSHDFRRPLTTFMGLAEVAKITVKDKNALELFSKVKETANNLDKMLMKLQSISDVGAQQLVYKEVMLKEIFDSVCDAFSEQLNDKGIKTCCEINLRDTFVSYPAMIKIVIDNLVENAISFCGKHEPFIRLKVVQDEDTVSMEFSDNGQGIDPKYHDRIFEMYFRGNEQSKGNGLGLFIVKKSMEKLGGEVTFISEYMKGSTFKISLPCNQQHHDFI